MAAASLLKLPLEYNMLYYLLYVARLSDTQTELVDLKMKAETERQRDKKKLDMEGRTLLNEGTTHSLFFLGF